MAGAGPIDPQIGLLRLDRADGKPLAVLYKFACHPIMNPPPDLKSCSAFGETPEEALREVLLSKEAWLAAARKHRKPVPEPRLRPAIYQLAS